MSSELVAIDPPAQSLGVFTSVVVIIAVGSLVVTIQAKVDQFIFLRATSLTFCLTSSSGVECMPHDIPYWCPN